MKREIETTAEVDKALAILVGVQGNTQTEAEYFATSVAPIFANWIDLASAIIQAPIVEKLKAAINEGDDAKVQAVKDALGVAKVDAAAAVAVK